MNTTDWNISEALELCAKVESICPKFGYHVALTGGLLYKSGHRKDCDILFYRIRQVESPDYDGMFEALRHIGLDKFHGFGWCHKAVFNGKPVDMFFPEETGGEYNPDFKS